MEQKSKFSSPTGFSGKLLVASLFILSGILLFARNMGWITAELFSIIVSWFSLFIIMGICIDRCLFFARRSFMAA